jgi:hypothetical protein
MHRNRLVIAIIAISITVSSAFPLYASTPAENVRRVTSLQNNRWTDDERKQFYHISEGPWYIPYKWFEILEAADSKTDGIKHFGSKEALQHYGLMVDSSINPTGLPVGFVISEDAPPRLGLTCAGCHTGLIEYRGGAFLIDGGSPTADMQRFIRNMFNALGLTVNNMAVLPEGTIVPDAQKFARFAQKYFNKDNPSDQEMETLRLQVGKVLEKVQEIEPPKERRKEIYPSPWGYGRLDAFGRGGNTLLALPALSNDNFWPASAPVSFPFLWGAYDYKWVQWNGSITQPMARNISQAITGSRRMEYTDPTNPYKSNVDVVKLHELEQLLWKLTPPRWPQGRFDKEEDNKAFAIDPVMAGKGKALFNELCVTCHVPSYSKPNKLGKQFLDLPLIPLKVIGTDPMHATMFGDRQVETGVLGKGKMPAVEFMKLATTEIRNQRYTEQNIPPGKYDEMDGFRENEWRAEECRATKDGKGRTCWRGYIARPLAGAWATPPFLHNGSVPSLYQLLSPVSERSRCFYLGHHEFDPKHVGYSLKECQGPAPQEGSDESAYYDGNGFKFFTSKPGNSNSGHEFSTKNIGKFKRLLRPNERLAIIEYLKTCDLEFSRDKSSWGLNKDKPPMLCTDEQAVTTK